MDGDGYGSFEPGTEAVREFCLEQLALCGEVVPRAHGHEDGCIGDAR